MSDSTRREIEAFLMDVQVFQQQLESVLRNTTADENARQIAADVCGSVKQIAEALTTALESYAALN